MKMNYISRKKIYGERKDPLTGELFVPKRNNQKFATRQNQIAYNNIKAIKKREQEAKKNEAPINYQPVIEKDLEYWKQNAEEDYRATPISVLRYITELEQKYEHRCNEVKDKVMTIHSCSNQPSLIDANLLQEILFHMLSDIEMSLTEKEYLDEKIKQLSPSYQP